MIIDSPSAVHSQLDLQIASQLVGLSTAENLSQEFITSPYDLCAVEALRDHLGLRVGSATPTDIFVFGKGEPDNPTCTKVGGRPWWPEDRQWPCNLDGSPRCFLAQFNFQDSVDILNTEIPEMLLSVTATAPFDWTSLAFHWVPVTAVTSSNIVVPSAFDSASTFFGVRYRSFDYGELLHESLEDIYLLPVLNGTKIGGVPYCEVKGNRAPGRFLCQLGSIQAHPDVPYPWTNHKAALCVRSDEDDGIESIYDEGNSVVYYDMESLCIFLMPDGTISYEC